MGIQDFSAIFDVLDPACRGHLTSHQIRQFYESLHFSSIDENHVTAAARHVCGIDSQDMVTKDKFLQVLQEIDRRRHVEEQARWDFQALDRTGSYLISVSDALLLFRNTHGENFSMGTWRRFLASRDNQSKDVSFDELRTWLCDHPTEGDGEESAVKDEQGRLAEVQQAQTTKEYEEYKKAKEESEAAHEKEEHRMRVRRGARRKLNRWETEGLEALLYDDGVDRGEDLPGKTTTKMGITDLLDKLDTKYDLLRTKLFWDMIRKQSNNVLLSESDQVDAFQHLQAQERQMRRDGSLAETAEGLQGGRVSHSVQLVGLMGGVGEQLGQVNNDVNERRVELRGEGRDEGDVEKTLRNDFERKVKGPVSSAALLVGLAARWEAERDELLGRLRGAAHNKVGQVVVEFGRLERQQTLLNLEEDFQAAATSTGLGERPQPPKYPRFDPDRLGQERLAGDRLRQRKGRKLKLPAESGSGKAAKGSSSTELMTAVIKEVTWKQAQEREVLVQLLLGRDAAGSKAAARQLSGPQRHHKQTSLRNQRLAWRNSNAQYRTTHKQQQIKILQEGMGLYCETVRSHLGGSDSAVCTAVLADLQQNQDAEFEELLTSLYGKKEKELENILVAEGASRKEEQLDTLARLLLGVFEERDEEKPLLAALNAKYDALRHALLLHVVREELGLAWNRLSDDERQRHLVKKKNEELRLRQEGRFEEMGQLISKLPKELGSLRQLIGEDREEFSRRQKVHAEKRDQAVVQGQDSSLVESNETPPDQTKSVNLLADLIQRYYVEQDFVIGWYRSPESKTKGQGYLHLPLVMLQVERKMCEREETFDRAALTVGLQERIEAANEQRHLADRERQVKLSSVRTEARRQRVENGVPKPKELDEYARPEKGDLVAWMESFLREQNKKHVEERELLLSVLQDPGLEELVEVARTMGPADRTSRLAELRVKRNKMDMEDLGQREENFSVIEEAAAIRCVIKRDHLEAARSDVSHRDVTVDLLTELQDEQDREMAGYIRKLPNMTEEDLKKGREYEINARHWRSAENVIQVLTRHEGEAEDDALLSALDEKYDALRDKLLLEALMAQLGEAEWGQLSEQERQRRLMLLKLKEKRLRRDGNLDELAKLLGENQQNEEALLKLMGDNRSEYERKLQERLARRQKRIDQGLDPDDDEEGLDELEDPEKKTNLLDDLQARYEAEKEALLRQMRGLDSKHLSERERQAELLRLKREARRAQREDKFGNAARLIGLAERQQGELSEKLKNDRLRQEQLAKDRLEALRKRRGEKPGLPSEEVLREGSKADLQDAVMKRLDERHTHERELLVHFLSRVDADPDLRLVAQATSALEREDKLHTLRDQRTAHALGSTSDNHATLQEACVYKFEGRRSVMETANDAEVTEDDVTVSLLADLQQQQEKEAESVLNDVLDKEPQELVDLQLRVIEETKQQRAENVAVVLFAPEANDQNDLIAALDSKYDALRDKLLIEALMKEAGEAEWALLTEAERQRRLAELKLKERQLRRQGKHDEASALLGEALKDHETLQALMGNSREEQERRLKERLERRKQRQAQGMSTEECDRLEQEEIAADEEEDKKKRNVLLDLMKNYDAEKDAILRALRDSQTKEERERLRQQEMARLRREQRRAKTEAKYDAAAIVLGLAQKQQLSVEAERARQEQLAKERLAARKAARAARQGAGQEEDTLEVVAPSDDKDLAGLQDAILQETELKHKAEQEALLKILEEESEGTHREAARALNAENQREKQDELRQRRALWRNQPGADNQPQMELLREGAGICLELTAERLAAEGKDNSNDALQVALLADLQQHQAHEMRALTNTLTNSDAPTLRQVKTLQAEARQRRLYDHAALTLLGADPLPEEDGLSPEEQEAVRELEKKYDAARDKLLIEALMREVGEREWAALTEQERQRRLVRLRLEERRLRREGKYDEVAALLGQLSKDQAALQEKLGASRSEQQRRLEERLARRAELKAEREAKGQPTDDVLLDAMVDQEMTAKEEEEDKKKSVLENLTHHFEDEKAALLAALRSHESREEKERHRQLQLARLRREKKLMEREEKFDSAAVLLSMAMKDEKKLEQRYSDERDRQRELAKERLAARRQRQKAGGQGEEDREEQEQLREAEEKLRAALEGSTDQGKDGVLVLHEAILEDMETKHGKERDALMDLLSEVQADPTALNAARQMGEEEAKMQLEQYRLDRVRWQKESRKASVRLAEPGVTDSEKENLQKTIKDGKKDQKTVLLSALAIKLKLETEAMKKDQPNLSDADVLEEAGVSLLADLQTKQAAELSAMEKVVTQQTEPLLVKLKDTQRQSKHCGWYENLTSALCTLPSAGPGPEPENDLPDQGAATQHLEEELQQEKNDHIEKLRRQRPGEEIDVDAAMKELEAQHNAKRKALQDAMDKQKRQLKERLDAKRRARETAEYEEEAAVALVRNAEREHSFVLEKKQKEQLRQKDLMAQRLAARRDARRQAQEEDSFIRETSGVMSDTSSRTNTPTLPGGRMRREKTALNVEVTEDQKKELFSQVVRENADWKRKISADQQRQQDQLQRRLRDRSNKRQEEADALFSLGMRQKTILQKTKQEERDRQIMATKERVARVRYERTMTMKDLGEKKARKFDELVQDQGTTGLSENERMALAAKRMESKFKEEREHVGPQDATEGEASGGTPPAATAAPAGETVGRLHTREEQLALLKQRLLQKKLERQKQESQEG